MPKLAELEKLGQSVWFDFIRRSLITSGELKELIAKGVRGITSNPAIFEKAIAGSSDYDDDIKKLSQAGKSVEEIYEALAFEEGHKLGLVAQAVLVVELGGGLGRVHDQLLLVVAELAPSLARQARGGRGA